MSRKVGGGKRDAQDDEYDDDAGRVLRTPRVGAAAAAAVGAGEGGRRKVLSQEMSTKARAVNHSFLALNNAFCFEQPQPFRRMTLTGDPARAFCLAKVTPFMRIRISFETFPPFPSPSAHIGHHCRRRRVVVPCWLLLNSSFGERPSPLARFSPPNL